MARKISAKHKRPGSHGNKKRARMRVVSAAPKVLTGEKAALEGRLGKLPSWKENEPLLNNYSEMGVLPNPNKAVKGKTSNPLKRKEQREKDGEPTYSDDDEFRAAAGLMRKSGKAAPRRISDRQRKFIGKLIEKHGDNLEAMKWDTKLNKFQHSVGKLKQYIESYHFWKPEEGLSLPTSMKKLPKLRY